MKGHYDLVIVGGGPAGMSAAINAEKYGLSVLLIEEQPNPGGQIYRNIEEITPQIEKFLDSDYSRGKNLVKKFQKTKVDYLCGTAVWDVQTEPDLVVSYILDEGAKQVRAKRVILATGARERPVAIPGSTLPGVMAATAADILLKANGVIPKGDTVLAGSGPLLLLIANHLISVGVTIQAILDTTPFSNYFAALKHAPSALLALPILYKGLQMQKKIRKNGIPVYRNVKSIEIIGNDSVESIRFHSAGKTQEILANTIFLHNGLIPDTQIPTLLNCDHEWDDVQRYWRPIVDEWGNTSVKNIAVIGDSAKVAGANIAEISGYLAGLEAAFTLKKISAQERNQKARTLQQQFAKESRIRPFLDTLYKPNPDLLIPQDDETIVCRCEELTARQIREALDTGLSNPNQVKALTRCGMGPCQGRMCSCILSEIIADHKKMDITDVGYLRIRPPIKPVTLEQLSKMELAEELEGVIEIS